MKTLLLRDGDLVIGASGGHETITGPGRVVQDLRCHLLEPLGNDRFHPGFGSQLDDAIGLEFDSEAQFEVQAEVHRVLNNYAAIQREKMEADALGGGRRSRFTTGEILASVSNVDVRRRHDTLLVDITLTTHSGETVVLSSEVGA